MENAKRFEMFLELADKIEDRNGNLCIDADYALAIVKQLRIFKTKSKIEAAFKAAMAKFMIAGHGQTRFVTIKFIKSLISPVVEKVEEIVGEISEVIFTGEEWDFFDSCKSLEEVKELYRKWAKRLHPDTKNGDSKTFEKLHSLYEVARAEFCTATESKLIRQWEDRMGVSWR